MDQSPEVRLALFIVQQKILALADAMRQQAETICDINKRLDALESTGAPLQTSGLPAVAPGETAAA